MKKNVEDMSYTKWWEPIEFALNEIDLEGLKIICPLCKEIGFVVSRWIKGPTLKPIYILHLEEGKKGRICEINKEQSKNIRSKVSILEDDIKRLLTSRKSYVLFSGGKDSLATLYYLKEIAKAVNTKLTAIYVDTTAGLPENTDYVKKVCDYLEVTLEIVRPKIDYFTLAKEWGIPGFKYRWCCRELKIKPIAEFLSSIKEQKVIFDGIRAVESSIRKQYIPIWFHPGFKCLSVSPIFHWTNQEVVSFINSNGIPKTILHSMGTSTECWCGAYKTEKDFVKLYELNKDMFYKLVEIEEGNKSGYTFLYKDGQKKTLRSLEKQILERKEYKRD